MDVWDFFYKQNDPVLNIKVNEGCALTSFNIQSEGKMIVCGSSDGTTTMYELSEGLTVMQQNEKASIQQMFERESKREKNLETRQKELKQKARRDMDLAAGDGSNEVAVTDEVIQGIEKEYFEAFQKESQKNIEITQES